MSTVATPAEPTVENENQRPTCLTREWLELRLVLVTLGAILLSLIVERLGWPVWIHVPLGIVAYAAGGFYGLQKTLHSLRQRRVDVDMLMILAALGAASIGDWHEGAILLFLFSLTNVLQDYAIGRSRQAIRGLLKLYPAEAKVRRDGRVQSVRLDTIRVGEIVLIEPG